MDYDTWKTTDPTWNAPDVDYENVQCNFFYKSERRTCNVYYHAHNDRELGHTFEMPEPEGRDY